MEICRIRHHKKDYLELLLLGDEQESMIDRYLERGDMYVLYDSGAAKAVCVVTEESEEILELKNLAVCSQCQRRGYGRRMIEFLCDQYKGKKRILPVSYTHLDVYKRQCLHSNGRCQRHSDKSAGQ